MFSSIRYAILCRFYFYALQQGHSRSRCRSGQSRRVRVRDSDLFDDLLFYYKYASSTYTDCASPNGNVMVQQRLQFEESSTDTQGFEITVAWRGSSAVQDFLITDADLILKTYSSQGVSPASGTKVHSGFIRSYNSIADQVISLVGSQLDANPGYTVVSTGHSLGGSLASLARVSLNPMRLYTYGQPRTGNQAYADLVNKLFGDQSFRYLFGFKHHGVEYWQTSDPAVADTLVQCAPGGEDPNCSDSLFSDGFTPPHLTYFGLHFDAPFCS
ncbi:alpha/beta-hydrolase [Mycena olivaceomarginata]|nr:alpha/beta-hydrolase [Mycena olivaceomarginata]